MRDSTGGGGSDADSDADAKLRAQAPGAYMGEEEFHRSGHFPPHARDQAVHKEVVRVAADLPILLGRQPVCLDFLQGECRMGRKGGVNNSVRG